MIRVMTVILAVLLALTAGSAVAQELMHYEGYTHNTSITPPGAVASSTGLVTALYPPLVYDFARFEYTYNLGRLTSMGSTTSDGIVFRTTYGVFGSFFDVFEDIDPTFPPGGTGGSGLAPETLRPQQDPGGKTSVPAARPRGGDWRVTGGEWRGFRRLPAGPAGRRLRPSHRPPRTRTPSRPAW